MTENKAVSPEQEKSKSLNDLSAQLTSFGYKEEEVEHLISKKIANYERISEVKARIKLQYSVPVRFITGWPGMNETWRRKALWDLGFNTKDYAYVEDVCCYTFAGKRECGIIVIGNERTDKEYLNLVINGRHVASDDARFFDDQETLHTMRGNKGVNKV